ncbi:MAG: hypothetical protein QGG40_06085, partial [Myxococcota bacterium]|nr:hypothetical protein [Myxococcota bacterium]
MQPRRWTRILAALSWGTTATAAEEALEVAEESEVASWLTSAHPPMLLLVLLIAAGLFLVRAWSHRWMRRRVPLLGKQAEPNPTHTPLDPIPLGGPVLLGRPMGDHERVWLVGGTFDLRDAVLDALSWTIPVIWAGPTPMGTPPRPRVRQVPGPVLPADILAILRSLDRACVIVLTDVRDLAHRTCGQRPEAQLAEFIDQVRPALDDTGSHLLILEPLAPDRISHPDVIGQRLLARVDAALIWTGARLSAVSHAPVTLAQWMVRGRDAWRLSSRAEILNDRLAWCSSGLLFAILALVSLQSVFIHQSSQTQLLGAIDESLPGSLWSNWWVYSTLVGADVSEFAHTTQVLWPVGIEPAATFGNLFASILSVPFQAIGGYPDYWNVFVLAALVTNGLATAALARTLGADRRGAVIAGAIFTVAPPILREVAAANQALFWASPLALALRSGLRMLDSDSESDAWWTGTWVAIASLTWW